VIVGKWGCRGLPLWGNLTLNKCRLRARGRQPPCRCTAVKSKSLLLVLCLLAPHLWGQVALQGPDLAYYRARLPHSAGPAVACVLADMDGDGDQDLIRATASNVDLALQDKSGRFIPAGPLLPKTSTAQAPVQAVAVGLLDLDKSPDVLIAHRDGTCRVVVNNGQGKFSASFLLPALGNVQSPALESVLVGNLDGVLGDDIVVILNQLPPQVYLADKSGGYDKPTALRGPPLLNPAAVLVDIDQDQDLDVLVVTGDAKASEPPPPYVYLNTNGQLGIAKTTFFSKDASLAASQVLAADINGNGRPEIIFATASGKASPAIYVRSSATSQLYQAQASAGKFTISTAPALLAADVNGDGFVDLIALQSDGSLVLGLNNGQLSPGTFGPPKALLGAGGRQCLAIGDLEPDKDIDLVVGGTEMEDSLLLGNGGGAFVDTEDRDMPIAKHSLSVGALVDATGDGDPDIVLYDRGGKPALLVNDKGQARFKQDQLKALPVALPALPNSTYTDVQAAAVASTRVVDLIVHGTSFLSSQAGVRILVRSQSNSRYYYLDETSTRWPRQDTYSAMAVGDIGGYATGSLGVRGYSDLVVLSTAGDLLLVLNNKGTYSIQKTAVASKVESGSRILLGHVNGAQDRLLDIVLLQPTLGIRVFLGRQKPVDTFLEGRGMKAAPGEGLLTDLNGDGQVDLLIATAQTIWGLQLFQGDGKGSFDDVSAKLLPATGLNPRSVSSLAVLRSATEKLPAVVVGLPDGADLLLRRVGGGAFSTPIQLPFRGSNATEQCLAGDLDLDGDDDLVTVRATVLPSVLLGQSLQLTQNSIAQRGRRLALSVRLPSATATGWLGVSLETTRSVLPGVGILRIREPILAYTFSGQTASSVMLPVPARLALMQIPAQLFVSDGQVFRMGNLDVLELTTH